jgi:3-hydroxybutyryl-CoA dehydratase
MIKNYLKIGKSIKRLKLGEVAEFIKTISETDIYLYAGLTGDFNTVHINQKYAENTFFKTSIAHGLLTAGLISTILGNQLPGPETIYVKQELSFLSPVRIGDTITASVELKRIIPEKNLAVLRTTCIIKIKH